MEIELDNCLEKKKKNSTSMIMIRILRTFIRVY